jgi:hypothetical protein
MSGGLCFSLRDTMMWPSQGASRWPAQFLMALISVATPSASERRLVVRSSLETGAQVAVVEDRIVGTEALSI